jgi:hypothetical protein
MKQMVTLMYVALAIVLCLSMSVAQLSNENKTILNQTNNTSIAANNTSIIQPIPIEKVCPPDNPKCQEPGNNTSSTDEPQCPPGTKPCPPPEPGPCCPK